MNNFAPDKKGYLSEKGKDWRPYDQFRTLPTVPATIQFVAREIFQIDMRNLMSGFESYISRMERHPRERNGNGINSTILLERLIKYIVHLVFFYRSLTFYHPTLGKLLEDTYLRVTRLYQSSVKLQRFVNLSRKRTLHLQAKSF